MRNGCRSIGGRGGAVAATTTVLFLLLLGAAAAGAAAVASPDACPSRPPQAHYSSKTAYQLVHGEDIQPEDNVRGCGAVYVWHLLRHGTRFPSDKEIVTMSNKLPDLQSRIAVNSAAGRTTLCADAVHKILSWNLNVTEGEGNKLTSQGEMDAWGVAKRFKTRYPSFFAQHSHPADFAFRSTDTQRTQETAKWYGRGLFEEPINLPKPVTGDPLLKFYDICDAWTKAVDNNATAHTEITKFQEGDDVEWAVQRISNRLGFKGTLSYEEVDLMWEACRYGQAWNPNQVAAWCAVFDDEDLLVFEYRADLKYYYIGGYGNDMDLQLGCPLVKDVVDKISAYAETGSAGASGHMYFTHSTALHMTMARLGIARDAAPLTADNYESAKHNRRWKISQLGPFASNLAVVLYQCPRGEKLKIRVYLNEKPTLLAGCTDTDALCSWTDFKNKFGSIAQSCSLDFCNRTTPSKGSSTLPNHILPIYSIFMFVFSFMYCRL